MPSSWAWSMIVCASAAGVSDPKFIVPRHSRLTERPERPRCVYSMPLAFHDRLSEGETRSPLRIRPRPEDAALGLRDRRVVDPGLAATRASSRFPPAAGG